MKVIVARTDAKLGETLLATPVYQALKEALSTLYLEAWVNPQWAFMLENSPWLDCVHKVPFRPLWWDYRHIIRKLRRERPDAILILRPDTLSFTCLAAIARVPVRAGAATQHTLIRRLLTHAASYKPFMHQVERNLAVAEAWLGKTLPRYPLHFAPARPAPLPSEVQSLPSRGYAVIHLGTGGVQPRWLPERFATVATFLKQNYGLIPVLSGAPSDLSISERCRECMREPVLDLTGRLTILELAEVLRRARVLISVDTGVVHLAAATGIPCVSLHFRLDYPPHQWHAWQVPYATVVPLEHCKGCTSLQCQPQPTRCVTSLYAEQVIEAIEQLLSST